jgi:hypothetical protein
MASESFASGTTPKAADTIRMLEEKILRALGGGGGSGGTGSVISGAGAPVADPGVTTALYVDTNTSTIYSWYSSAWH